MDIPSTYQVSIVWLIFFFHNLNILFILLFTNKNLPFKLRKYKFVILLRCDIMTPTSSDINIDMILILLK